MNTKGIQMFKAEKVNYDIYEDVKLKENVLLSKVYTKYFSLSRVKINALCNRTFKICWTLNSL